MLHGERWFGVWPNDPKLKKRPLLIVSNNHRNNAKHIKDLIVVKLTQLERSDGSLKPVNVAEDIVVQLKKKTIIKCASIYSIEKKLLKIRAYPLDPEIMAQVSQKLKIVLNLD